VKGLKNELQDIIIGNGPIGHTSQLKKVQNFLSRYAQTSPGTEEQKRIKSEEEKFLIDFAYEQDILYQRDILEDTYISAGAEQRVYRYDDHSVIKLNDSVFYEYWLDYFNSLLIHNYFFKSTAYDFLGFKIISNHVYAVVKQNFIVATEVTNLKLLQAFLEYNGFSNLRNNDYHHTQLGLIFEDLHDENVLSRDGILYFIDTIFYLTKHFYE